MGDTPDMQPFRSVREVLASVEQVHHQQCARLAAAALACDDHRHRALLEYLRDREAEQFSAIHRLLAGDDEVLESFVQSVPAAALAKAAAGDAPSPDFDAIVAWYRERDRALIQAYEQLAANVGQRARDTFAEFAKMRQLAQSRLQEALFDA